jgi:hypothetical protein
MGEAIPLTAENYTMNPVQPFRFSTDNHLVELTGLRASSLSQRLDIPRDVPGSSVFHHTRERFLALHFEKPVVYNDFAVWVTTGRQNLLVTRNVRDYMLVMPALDHPNTDITCWD